MSYDGSFWTLRSGIEIKPHSHGQAWQKSYKLTTYGGYYYQPLAGFYYGWLTTTVYTDYYQALTLCSGDTSCTGIVKVGTNKYKLCGGKTFKRFPSFTLYKKEGLVNTESYVFYGGYGWKSYSPYELPGKLDNKVFSSRDAAFDACIQNPKCVGFTEHAVNKFVLSGK